RCLSANSASWSNPSIRAKVWDKFCQAKSKERFASNPQDGIHYRQEMMMNCLSRPVRGLQGESQGDSASKPRVARNELPWVTLKMRLATPTGLRHGVMASSGTTPSVLALRGWHGTRVACV